MVQDSKSKSTAINADIVKVNTIFQSIQILEHRLNNHIISFNLNQPFDSFISNVNPLR